MLQKLTTSGDLVSKGRRKVSAHLAALWALLVNGDTNEAFYTVPDTVEVFNKW